MKLTAYRRQRIKDPRSYREKAYVQKWLQANIPNFQVNHGWTYLEAALSERPNDPPEVSERDKFVALNLIAWLGTPVGQEFLRQCNLAADAARE